MGESDAAAESPTALATEMHVPRSHLGFQVASSGFPAQHSVPLPTFLILLHAPAVPY